LPYSVFSREIQKDRVLIVDAPVSFGGFSNLVCELSVDPAPPEYPFRHPDERPDQPPTEQPPMEPDRNPGNSPDEMPSIDPEPKIL
jgi:hypothetical protein